MGFYELFEGLIELLEREMKNSSNPDTKMQLIHSITCLKSPEFKEFRADIRPFIANPSFNRK